MVARGILGQVVKATINTMENSKRFLNLWCGSRDTTSFKWTCTVRLAPQWMCGTSQSHFRRVVRANPHQEATFRYLVRASLLEPREASFSLSSLLYTPTIHKKRRRALRALFSAKSLKHCAFAYPWSAAIRTHFIAAE